MDEFMALMAQLQNPGEEGVPASIYDDLTSSYSALYEGGNAKVGELNGMVEQLQAEIATLKAVNYDLLMAVPSNDGQSTPDGDESSDDDDADPGIDDLFQ